VIKFAPIIAGAVAAVLLAPCATAAQLFTTFVSGDGDDMNPCTRTAPCRSFAQAVLLTASGGSVTMVDPGGYGAVTITRAISIVNDGSGEAGVADMGGAGQDAITIQAGPSDVINLRGLTLNGLGTGRHGINFVSGGTLNIQNCVIRAFPGGDGVFFNATASAALAISDTIVSNNNQGIVITTSAGTVVVDLQRVLATGNQVVGVGLSTTASGTLQGTIADSVAANNVAGGANSFGFQANGTGAKVALVNSKAVYNAIGLGSASGATMYISETTVSGNTMNGYQNSSSSLQTFGDNYIIDTSNTGVLTPIPAQ
jgi:hypothetical protein